MVRLLYLNIDITLLKLMNIAGKVIEVLFCCFVTQWNVFCTLGVCLGFSIMEQVESVNVPFTILRTRFRQCKFRFCLALV